MIWTLYYSIILIMLIVRGRYCWNGWRTSGRHAKSFFHSSTATSERNDAHDFDGDDFMQARKRVPTTPDLSWSVKAIGKVECSYLNKFQVPKQATILPTNKTTNGTVISTAPAPDIAKLVIFPEYRACLDDLEGFDYLWLIGLFHLNRGFKTHIRPRPVSPEQSVPTEVGLFSSRAPHRPNPIALSALRIVNVSVSEGVVYVEGVDMVHDSPILDIKPYLPAFDSFPDARSGWMDLIRQDYLQARVHGYQNIVSTRGARFARSMEKKKKASKNQHEVVDQEGVQEDV